MRVMILGIDGYIGWSLACAFASKGDVVWGVDSLLRRTLVENNGGCSAIPIQPIEDRWKLLRTAFHAEANYEIFDISKEYERLLYFFKEFKPDVIYNLAQIPSAPYSMASREKCIYTMENNVIGNLNVLYAMKEVCPDAHLIKIGTMGEYGTPDIPIPEGKCKVTVGSTVAFLPFPRSAGSWYHQTKVHDTHNIRMACDIWGIRCTDIMQGIVYGVKTAELLHHPELNTRLDFDDQFGTIINRFVVQAIIGHPLTVYGSGQQIRSILPLQDSINCLQLLAANPPEKGVYREVNQFYKYAQLNHLANVVALAAEELFGENVVIKHIMNPRKESESHIYKPAMEVLPRLGYINSEPIGKTIRCMMINCFDYKDSLKLKVSCIDPNVFWAE